MGMRPLCQLSLVVLWIASNAACVASGASVGEGGSGGMWSTETGATSTGKSGAAVTTTVSTTEAGTGGSSTSYPSSSAVTATTAATTTSAMSSSSSGTPCQQGTRITYGSLWKAPLNHPNPYDDILGMTVTWDGVCTPQAPSSYATLSNGWQPYFQTQGGCVMALDPECPATPPAPCMTRITYGSSWLPAPNHPDHFDDIPGKVTWSNARACVNFGTESYADLSNGWRPYFQGTNACAMSFRYENCGGV